MRTCRWPGTTNARFASFSQRNGFATKQISTRSSVDISLSV